MVECVACFKIYKLHVRYSVLILYGFLYPFVGRGRRRGALASLSHIYSPRRTDYHECLILYIEFLVLSISAAGAMLVMHIEITRQNS